MHASAIAAVIGVAVVGVEVATFTPSNSCPFVRNESTVIDSRKPTTTKTEPTPPKRTLTVEDALELELLQVPAKRKEPAK